jgi:hypothetical protein
MIPLIGMTGCAVGFVTFGAWYFWPNHGSTWEPAPTVAVPNNPAAPTKAAKPTVEPDRPVLGGPTKARADWLSIKKQIYRALR